MRAMLPALCCLALLVAAGPAAALREGNAARAPRPPSAAQAAQHERMRSCSAEARGRGAIGRDARRLYMSSCLRRTGAGQASD